MAPTRPNGLHFGSSEQRRPAQRAFHRVEHDRGPRASPTAEEREQQLAGSRPVRALPRTEWQWGRERAHPRKRHAFHQHTRPRPHRSAIAGAAAVRFKCNGARTVAGASLAISASNGCIPGAPVGDGAHWNPSMAKVTRSFTQASLGSIAIDNN